MTMAMAELMTTTIVVLRIAEPTSGVWKNWLKLAAEKWPPE